MESVRNFEKSNKFHLISSNRLENLTADLAERMNSSCGKSILTPETVIVQSRGMERYLRLELAKIQGISANMEFPFPQKFASEYVFKPLLDGKKENPLDLGVFTWDIFKVLPELAKNDDDFKPLRSYLADDPSKIKTFQLSQRIANLFEQYVVFRPDIVRKWSFDNNSFKENPHSVWQAKLWHKVVPYYNGFHFADLYWHFLKCTYPDIYGESSLKKPDFDELKKVKRIFLFGFSAMAPIFLDLFLGVSKYIDVYFYYLNPCEAEWQYDLSERAKLHLQMQGALVQKADFNLEPELEIGNALLSSMGGQGREFFALLGSTEEEAEAVFDDCYGAKNLLQKVQRDIQLSESPAKEEVSPEDRSIQVHSCHTPMREVEVLFENLSSMFQADSTLLPKDILVLTPDINTYSPYIEAVFKSRADDDPRRCFITLADRSQASASLEAETFLNILKLTRSRFKASEVMGIWETPAVAAAFALDEKMVAIVRQWIIDAKIFWGIDGEFREETVGINFSEQSWRQGIERILAGFAFGSETEDSGRTFTVGKDDILPFHCCEGDSAVMFGKLVDFLESLFALRIQLNSDLEKDAEAFSVGWWDKILSGVIDKFFPDSNEFARPVALLREAVKTTLDSVVESEYEGEISFDIIYDEISEFFKKAVVGGGFLRGGITFCEARPLRSIPARVVCLLGLDEKSFPRKEKHLSFDLMAYKPRLGDRSARKDDRYLFLETLLSARDCFYVSYVGQGVKDNEPRLPSVVLCELLDYIGEHYSLSKESLTTVHPLQAFSWKYFIDESAKDSYAAKLGIKIPDNLISYSAEDKELAKLRFEDFKAVNFADNELQEIPEELYRIDLDDLCDFFANPAKYFLQKCLQIYPQIRDLPELVDCENFELSGLERHKIAERILKEQLPRDVDFDSNNFKNLMQKHFHVSGVLPVKAWGDIEFTKFLDDFIPFAKGIAEKIGQPLEALNENHTFENGVLLQACFDDLYTVGGEKQQIQFKYSNVKSKAKHLIRASLYELAANAMEVVPENSALKLIGKDGEKSFGSKNSEAAKEKLARLTDLYLEGLRKPLAFFPDTSLAYVKKGDINAALKKWESSKNYSDGTSLPGEGDDAYVSCCFGKTFKATEEFENISSEIVELLGLGGGK
jgi:exodeoxyribonuclease V gamma subunit